MYDSETGMEFTVDNKDTCRPLFRMEAKQNKAKTLTEGRPIFDQVPFVTIISPGDNKNVPDTKVLDEHRQRWPRQWEAFEKGLEQPINGTPINQWPILNNAQVAELKALNIHTIEEMASLSDGGTQQIVGLMTLKQQAIAHLATSKDDGVVYEALDKVEKLEERMTAMLQENKELRAAVEVQSKYKRKKKIDVSADDISSGS
tara:strand:- start:279 stop:884 length:606 start_codon:yes stop_codon:yes gene_type:complete